MTGVRVPATSANLGPGFDALGIALDLWLTVRAEPATVNRFSYRGDGHLADTPDNLVHKGFQLAYARVGKPAPSVHMLVDNPIPLARGLGSSSAALVAGAAIADAFLDGALGRDGVFELTADIEGHPDNVAPAVYGGFTVSALHPGGGYTRAMLPVPSTWRFLFGVPDFPLETERARAALPLQVPRAAAVITASRAALWALAVARDEPELLRTASVDVLHEPHREALIPGFASAQADVRALGAYAAFLSGAGPTLGVVAGSDSHERCRERLHAFVGPHGRVLELAIAAGYEPI